MKPYTATVIGCGNMGIEENNFGTAVRPGTHAAAYHANPRTTLVGLADTSKERLEWAKKCYPKIPVFSSAKQLLKTLKPDIVSIATQPDSHASLTILAAQHKVRAIVCEKPITISTKGGQKMIDACKKNGSLLFINHGRRFDPLIRKCAADIKNGFIGEVLQATCYSYNGLMNNGTHTVDLLRFLLGEITAVQGWTNEKTSKSPHDKNVDARICFSDGAYATLQTLSPNYGLADCYIYGTKGRIAIQQLGYRLAYTPLIENKEWKGYHQLSAKSKIIGKPRSFMKSMVAHVVSCLNGEEVPVSSGQDGLRALQVLFALRKSAQAKGKRINIPV